MKELKQSVCQANLELVDQKLVQLTWGNASACDRLGDVFFIKPSGVVYGQLVADKMVSVSLSSGDYLGLLKPSSDAPTHRKLYNAFEAIGGVVHTHSPWATAWAQACKEIPCLGTTHADHFYGPIPVTRKLTQSEVDDHYEEATAAAIIERFADLDPLTCPGVLVAEHGPFTWGKTVQDAVRHAIVLEEIAKMAFHTIQLGKDAPIGDFLLNKHYLRKHGPNAYYGQGSK